MPTHWATKDLENINFDKIRYYLASGQKPKRTWDEVPDDIKKTFERLGIPEQERKFLAGVEAQFDSEAAYSNVKDLVAIDRFRAELAQMDTIADLRDLLAGLLSVNRLGLELVDPQAAPI
jgi:Fe-S cluster assembly scaffold protein SufB